MTPLRTWSFFALAISVAAVCVRLGFWQLARLQEQRNLNAAISSKLGEPQVELRGSEFIPADLAYRRARVRGIFDADHEIILRPRARNGLPGAHLVTPLQIENSGDAILVDRGWIPDALSTQQERKLYHLVGTVELEGILLPSQAAPGFSLIANPTTEEGGAPADVWRTLEIEAIQSQLPYRVLPFYMALNDPPLPAQDQPIPDLEIDLSEGPHLGYAIQWFAFAAIGLGGGGYWVYRQTRLQG